MRVTGGMIRNNSLNSLYDNMSRLDTLFSQMDTMKKIQKPSDDPIILGRSLKLRLNVMENEQHQSNVDEANAWMDVTETALSNMTEILKEIRTKCNQAANDTLTPEDRQKIQLEIEG
ncbi:MAG: flagellar hook-associated protein 3, partial [Cellulosilyticaceae bacterium]